MAGIRGTIEYDDKGNVINATGGYKTAITNRERHGSDWYQRIGSTGGKNGHGGGFAANILCNCDILPGEHKKQRCSGVKGGKISRRGRSEANYKFKKGIEYDEKRTTED